jgi:uncharacterized protein (DUF2062 family)
MIISNPLTVPIVYFLQYELGHHILGLQHQDMILNEYSLRSILDLGWHILLPLQAGGILSAPFFAIPAYFMVYHFVRRMRNKRQS